MIRRLYQFLVYLCTWPIMWHMNARIRAGKEDAARVTERYGIASHPAFTARPLWIHAASVGEALSALTLISLMRTIRPDLPVLLTTGTVTSARVVSGRLPAHCIHQYAPLDHPVWVRRFLDYWRPLAAWRIESEIWPTTLSALDQRKIPVVLFNARLSDNSFSAWSRMGKTAQHLFGLFHTVLADGTVAAERFKTLGAHNVHITANIKFIAAPDIVAPEKLDAFKQAIHDRPIWLYASTHADEESIAADIHTQLSATYPNLLTIIVPRHPARVTDIRAQITAHYRSEIGDPTPDTQIYVADTMGEMSLFYSACPFAVIGRSFSRDGGGGHNPIEPALYGCFPLSGPNVQNLQTIFAAMAEAQAVTLVQTPADLAATVDFLLRDLQATKALGLAAQRFVETTKTDIAHTLGAFMRTFFTEVAP